MKATLYLLALNPVASPTLAECDFRQPIGGYQAWIAIESLSGSKVEYFLDSTSHTTIIKSGSVEGESLFGTKPITKKNISIAGCTAYADSTSSDSARGASASADEQGT